MEIKHAISYYTESLREVSDTAHLDAECLVTQVTGLSRAELFTHPEHTLTQEQQEALKHCVHRRLQGEPIAYITGHKEFWDLELKVTPEVLIPRPETECLVEWILEHYTAEHRLAIADLGVGSGAIALALAHERPHWTIDATDYSKDALHIAKENAKTHHINNVHFFEGTWCEALPKQDYDIIVSNPPYIASNDPHLKKLSFEPIAALAAGKEGLDAIRILILQAKAYLNDRGILIFEHGYNQRDAVLALLNKAGYSNAKDHVDLSGQPRFSVAQI